MALSQQQMALTATADVNGNASVTLPPLVGASQMIMGIICVSTTGDVCTASVMLNDYPVCQTDKGNLDTASGWPPVIITSKDTFGVEWSGCTQGDQCQAVFYWTLPQEQGHGVRAQQPISSWQGY